MPTETTEEVLVQSDDRKPHPGGKLTLEEFNDWLDDKTHAEWVEGEVRIMAPASDPHQMMLSFFDSLLTFYVVKHDFGEIRVAPFQVRLSHTSREPDVIFVARDNIGRIKRTFLNGAPDLVIEILSPSTRHIDRGEKYYEYEEAGVREYWMIDPDRKQAEFLRLSVTGRFEPVALENGVFQSETLSGMRLEVEWLWNAPLTNIHAIAHAVNAL
jgi:Uma2 family endonuclease